MQTANEFREYENGVADILASIVGDKATVRRNVRLASRSGGRKRQIDVYLKGDFFGLTDVQMIVDCKRWKKAIDIADVETFIGMLDDVGADMGMLVSVKGASDGALARARSARGVRVKALSIGELNSWRPRGTVFRTIEVAESDVLHITKALREAGLRVLLKSSDESGTAQIEAFRHHGTPNPSGEIQQEQHELTDTTLNSLNVPYKTLGQGVVIQGGTPSHRWLPVHCNGQEVMKILVATEADIGMQLSALAKESGFPRSMLTVERPAGWPFAQGFGL